MLILFSGSLSLLHRHIAQLPPSDIGDIAQIALVMTEMMVASLGVLLLIFGKRLFAEERRPARFDDQQACRAGRVRSHRYDLSSETSKAMLATSLANRAEAAAAARRQRG